MSQWSQWSQSRSQVEFIYLVVEELDIADGFLVTLQHVQRLLRVPTHRAIIILFFNLHGISSYGSISVRQL